MNQEIYEAVRERIKEKHIYTLGLSDADLFASVPINALAKSIAEAVPDKGSIFYGDNFHDTLLKNLKSKGGRR